MAEVAYGYFPDYDVQWDVQVGRKYSTQVSRSKTGKMQRRRMYPSPASDGTGRKGGYGYITASSDAFDATERVVVANFLDSVEGAFRAFYLWRRDRDNFANYEIGTISGVSSIIIPFRDSLVTSVTVNDVSKGFTVTSNIGSGGEDRINFTAGVQTGVVRVTLRGRERWLVHATRDDVVESFIANAMNQFVVVNLSFEQVR